METTTHNIWRDSGDIRSNDDILRALAIIKEGLESHQYYVDRPRQCNAKVGSKEVHIKWVKNYKHLEKVIRNLDTSVVTQGR